MLFGLVAALRLVNKSGEYNNNIGFELGEYLNDTWKSQDSESWTMKLEHALVVRVLMYSFIRSGFRHSSIPYLMGLAFPPMFINPLCQLVKNYSHNLDDEATVQTLFSLDNYLFYGFLEKDRRAISQDFMMDFFVSCLSSSEPRTPEIAQRIIDRLNGKFDYDHDDE